MPAAFPKRKRTAEHLHKSKKPKKFKKQKHYHSSSEEESDDEIEDAATDFAPVNMEDSGEEVEQDKATAVEVAKLPTKPEVTAEDDDEKMSDTEPAPADEADPDDEEDIDIDDPASDDDLHSLSGSDAGSLSSSSSTSGPKKRKRNDPTAFATSMSKILSAKLSVSKRADPVLARSAGASAANREMAESRLELKAKQQIRADRKAALERGRVRDVLGLETEGVVASEVMERERRLKKTAQRGVVKLFNAVRAAQVQAETARERTKKDGVVGIKQRDEKVNEMSKQGFLDLIAKGGKKTAAVEHG